MNPGDTGIPPVALLQLLERGTLGPRATGEFWAVMVREGVDLATLVERGEQVPLRWFYVVYPDLDVEQATTLGMILAKEAQLTTFGPLSLPLISAGSVSEVVELLTYLPVISTAVSPSFYRCERGLTVGLSGRTNDPVLDCLAIAYCGYALLRLLDILVDDLQNVVLNLGWSASTALEADRRISHERVKCGSPASFVYIPKSSLDEVCLFSDAVAYRIAVEALRRGLAVRGDRISTTERVTRLIERDLAGISARLAAAELCISVSTLNRQLSDEGTSFRKLQQSLLQDRAVLRLLNTASSVSEIAAELGYSDVANFSHAFKRWTSKSPREFRLRG